MIEEFIKDYVKLKDLHAESYEKIIHFRQKMSSFSKEDLVDFAFVLREMGKLADDIRKECVLAKDTAERLVCLIWITNNDEAELIVRGKYGSGTPNIRLMSSLPKQSTSPKEYNALMTYLGIKVSDNELVRPHWPAMTEHITALARAGKPLPPGIDPKKTYSLYSLSPLRKRPGIELGEKCE